MKNHLSVTSTIAPMANHPRRSWRKQWTVDLAARQARHESGAVVQFEPWNSCELVPPNARASDPIIPRSTLLNRAETIRTLTAQHGAAAAAQMIERLQRDAGDVYHRATHAQHPQTS